MDIIFLVFFFIIGTAVGSFLNVLIDRLPNEQEINGRSHCDYCQRNLDWYELIPLVSFFLQGGKSRCCHKKISWQYPTVEMTTGVAFLLISNFKFQISNIHDRLPITDCQLLLTFGIVSCLIVIFFSDLKYQIIPDSVQVVFFGFSMIFRFITVFPNYYLLATNYLVPSLIVLFPILFLWLITKGKGMGFGDVKFSLIMGVLLGLKGGLVALYLAFITGGIVGLILVLLKKKKLKSKIAFGPFLAIGTIIMLFFADKV